MCEEGLASKRVDVREEGGLFGPTKLKEQFQPTKAFVEAPKQCKTVEVHTNDKQFEQRDSPP